jgi:hypothetical protein
MGYWQNGAYFIGDRIIPKSDEYTDKQLSRLLKRNLEKTYEKIEQDNRREREVSEVDPFD